MEILWEILATIAGILTYHGLKAFFYWLYKKEHDNG